MTSPRIYPITPKKARILSNNIRWKIMELLVNDETQYAKSIAKTLGLSEQKIHYHIALLRDEGFLTPTKVVPIKRGRAKLFRPVSSNFLLSLGKNIPSLSETAFNIIFEKEFVDQGQFNGKVIVGSAEPHGNYDAVSRDGYLAGNLCMYIGTHLPLQQGNNHRHFVCTDLDYKPRNSNYRENLILIGGHITNILTSQYNNVLKSKFDIFFLENRIVGVKNEFTRPTHGLIAKFKNPRRKNSWVLVLAGVGSLGTRAVIHSIIFDCCEILGLEDEFISILQGESKDGVHISGVKGLIKKSI